MKNSKKILITAALPYANGPLHFGHIAGAYLPADCYARFERLQGSDVLFICGSDEYGAAIALSAEIAKRKPRDHVALFHAVNKGLFDQLHICFDHFSRTTCSEHQPLVQEFFKDLLANGYIESKETEQLYSEKDHRFLADRYVVGICPSCGFEEARGDECIRCAANYEATDLKHPRSKLTHAPLVLKKTVHWFLKFDLFKDKLSKFLESRVWRSNITNFVKPYIAELRPRAITRDLEWGVEVPLKEADGKVFYVWFDAPIGYISATQEWAKTVGKEELWKEYWLDPKTKYVQFIGKDNIPFHALFFPAMIMGQNQPYKCVDDLVANEFYNLEGKQFSKSEGWMIDLEDFFKRFQTDQIRYVLAANAPETADSEFTWKDFQNRCNAELVGKFGNFINRVLVLVQNVCGGKTPQQHALEDVDHRFLNDMSRLLVDIKESFSSYRLRKVCQLMMELSQKGNAYFDVKAPWKDAKLPERIPVLETTLALCLECMKALVCASAPIIPATAQKIWQMLGFSSSLDTLLWQDILEAKLVPTLPKPIILFSKIEDNVIEEEIAKLKTISLKKTPPSTKEIIKEPISIEEFRKIDLRVGVILKAEKVAKSKKLLKLELDIGGASRTVLSGISEHYTPEELVGKKVMVVANLKPTTLMGIESAGMILTASNNGSLELITFADAPSGSAIS